MNKSDSMNPHGLNVTGEKRHLINTAINDGKYYTIGPLGKSVYADEWEVVEVPYHRSKYHGRERGDDC